MDICYIFALRKILLERNRAGASIIPYEIPQIFSRISERTKATNSHLGRGVSMVVFTFRWAYFAVCLYGVITCLRPLLSFLR